MSKSVKILLIVLACGAAAVVLFCGGVFLWVSNNKDAIAGIGNRANAEADAFAADHDAAECADATLARYRRDPTLMNQVESKIYFMRCLQVAEKPAGFCQTIPETTSFLRATVWCRTECANRGAGRDEVCPRLMQTVIEYCDREGRMIGVDLPPIPAPPPSGSEPSEAPAADEAAEPDPQAPKTSR